MMLLDCREALNKKVIPGYVFKDSDNSRHITASQLNWRYGLHTQTIKKLVRTGELKAGVIKSKTYSDTLVFLKRDNPELPNIIREELSKKVKREP